MFQLAQDRQLVFLGFILVESVEAHTQRAARARAQPPPPPLR
jgi:hypothetical protein